MGTLTSLVLKVCLSCWAKKTSLFLPLMCSPAAKRQLTLTRLPTDTYTELSSYTRVREAGQSATFLHPVDPPETEAQRKLAQSTSQHSICLSHTVLVGVSYSYLLSLGADPELENECGEKPADLIDPDSKELLELFGLAVND